MFDKNIDLLVLGKSYPSLMLGLETLSQNKSVLIVDDDRYQLGHDFVTSIGEFERKYLELWADTNSIGNFHNLDKYLSSIDLTFIVGNKRIRLGRDYWSNLMEIIRKLEFNWDLTGKLEGVLDNKFKDEFNELMHFYLKDLAFRLLRTPSSNSFIFEDFIRTAPEILRHLFIIFKKGMNNNHSNTITHDHYILSFLYAAKGHYQFSTALNLNDTELFHLFISILTPYYQINHDKLMSDLLELYIQEKGVFKKTRIHDWSFDKNIPWALELSSYEGLIHPNKIAVFASDLIDPSLYIYPETKLYFSVKILGILKEFSKNNSKFIVCSDKMLGTDRPFWSMNILDGNFEASFYMEHRPGKKLSLIKDNIYSYFMAEISRNFPHLVNSFEDIEIIAGNDVCHMADKSDKNKKIDMRVKYIDSAGKNLMVKNIHYLGPQIYGGIGPLSTFIDISKGKLYESVR